MTGIIGVTPVTDILTITDAPPDAVTCNVTETPPILIGLSNSPLRNADGDISTSDSQVDEFATVTRVEIHNNYSDMVTSGTNSGLWSFTTEANFFSILFLTICGGGLFGNTISLILLNRKSIKQLPCRLILIVLTCNDSLYLLVAYPVLWQVVTYYTWICIADMYAFIFTVYYSKFLIMGISLERFIVICFPMKAKTFINRKIEMMYCIISLLAIVAGWSYGPHFQEAVPFQTKYGISYQCALTTPGVSYLSSVGVWLQLCFTLIPTVVAIVCTITMIVALVRSCTLSGKNDSSAKKNVMVS